MVWSGFNRNGNESGNEQVGMTHIHMSHPHNKGHCTGVHIGIKGVRNARNEKQETWTWEKCMPRGLKKKKKDTGDEGDN